MRLVTTLAWWALLTGAAWGQAFPQPNATGTNTRTAQSAPQARWSTPAAEAHAAALDLSRLRKAQVAGGSYDIAEIRYFSLYAVPATRRDEVLRALHFWCNSLSTSSKVYRLEPVPDTGGLLYRAHLSNFNWTPQAWEQVSEQDPFFREPFVSAKDAAYLRYYAGNAIVRADWFIENTSDTTESQSYYRLTYANAKVRRGGKEVALNGQPPATGTEFRDVWRVDVKGVQDYRLDRGAIVPDGTSLVAYSNRILWRMPTIIGPYWQTFDVIEPVDKKDFVENRFPKEWDASEYIMRLPNGLQTFFLSDGQDKRIEFADPRLAKDSLNEHITTVRTGHACAYCHAPGILPSREFLSEILQGGTRLYEQNPVIGQAEEEFYLNGTAQLILDDQASFARAIRACNGLTGEENARGLLHTINAYRSAVTLQQAALECGTTPAKLQAALSFGTTGRLSHMATQGGAIPRKAWDKTYYAQAMGLLQVYHQH